LAKSLLRFHNLSFCENKIVLCSQVYRIRRRCAILLGTWTLACIDGADLRNSDSSNAVGPSKLSSSIISNDGNSTPETNYRRHPLTR
jgi:hypothetical protein